MKRIIMPILAMLAIILAFFCAMIHWFLLIIWEFKRNPIITGKFYDKMYEFAHKYS